MTSADSAGAAAVGRIPLKTRLRRVQRRQHLRGLALVAPLLAFVLVTFVGPIADMLFRSVENDLVSETLPRTVKALAEWDRAAGQPPDEEVFLDFFADLSVAREFKTHTRLGSRLNYERSGMSSLFRKTGRALRRIDTDAYREQLAAVDAAWTEPERLAALFAEPGVRARLPDAAWAWDSWTRIATAKGDAPSSKLPGGFFFALLSEDLKRLAADAASLGDAGGLLRSAAAAADGFTTPSFRAAFAEIDEDWVDVETWSVIRTFSPRLTEGYFLAAADLKKAPEGIEQRPENERIYLKLFWRTLVMSLAITGICLLLGYPVALLLATLPLRTSNLLMILVLLPFWTSLLVRTSAWKVLLQQQGVVNDLLVWAGIVADDARLALINNQFGTIVAMTHILLPFMILPLYSVMRTIPPSYVRAALSLGASRWMAFRRVYLPLSGPGVGAGCVLVFILAIGYYITPELVGGRTGTFISNRIAYHISSSLNWGLAAALGTILLVAVLILYWVYDRVVGIDNVKLG